MHTHTHTRVATMVARIHRARLMKEAVGRYTYTYMHHTPTQDEVTALYKAYFTR